MGLYCSMYPKWDWGGGSITALGLYYSMGLYFSIGLSDTHTSIEQSPWAKYTRQNNSDGEIEF